MFVPVLLVMAELSKDTEGKSYSILMMLMSLVIVDVNWMLRAHPLWILPLAMFLFQICLARAQAWDFLSGNNTLMEESQINISHTVSSILIGYTDVWVQD